ncbi:hypothetical protein B0T14DRAFT_565444 [Immersiella caudata]|uniref:Uncharacterized protein n=1 Tax=Immersiella caudata TaxID=314043 RepID=A0AA39WZD8_9PEZI|nr:hypothetical protein B0T14DRAFT_565444 [Immersiella caudata]
MAQRLAVTPPPGSEVLVTLPNNTLFLTDNLHFPNNNGPITLWSGLANPIPPFVNSNYWATLCIRAEGKIKATARAEFSEPAPGPNLKGKRLANAVKAKVEEFRGDEDRTTWCFAMELLVYDLVCLAEGDFVKSGDRTLTENLERGHALRVSRRHLPFQFFDWLKATADVDIVPREFLGPEEFFSGDGELQWFGTGEWVTTMSLE